VELVDDGLWNWVVMARFLPLTSELEATAVACATIEDTAISFRAYYHEALSGTNLQ
jgi:hypothetical protein